MTWTEQHQVTPLAAKHIVDGPLSSSPAGVLVPGYHTFSWDGSDWHDSGPDGPGARFGAAVAYDPRHRQSVLFGGCCIVGGGPESVYDDTWSWDGDSWLRRGGSRPPAESGTAVSPTSPWIESALPLGSVDAITADRDAVYAVVERLQLGMWDLDRAMVARLDRATGQVTMAGPFPAADSLALAGGRLWVGAGVHPGIVNPGHQALYGVDPATLQVEQELSLLPAPDASQFSARLAGTGNLLWLGWGNDLIRIDPHSGAVLNRLDPGGGGVDDVALSPGGDRLYVTTRLPSEDALISVREPRTGAMHATATEHSTAGARLAAVGDGVWIPGPTGLSSALSHRRATDLGPLGPAPALGGDGHPSGNTLRAFVADGVLWLADSQRSTLSCADPRSGAIRASAGIARAQELAGDAGGIYLGTTDGVVVIGLDPRCAGCDDVEHVLVAAQVGGVVEPEKHVLVALEQHRGDAGVPGDEPHVALRPRPGAEDGVDEAPVGDAGDDPAVVALDHPGDCGRPPCQQRVDRLLAVLARPARPGEHPHGVERGAHVVVGVGLEHPPIAPPARLLAEVDLLEPLLHLGLERGAVGDHLRGAAGALEVARDHRGERQRGEPLGESQRLALTALAERGVAALHRRLLGVAAGPVTGGPPRSDRGEELVELVAEHLDGAVAVDPAHRLGAAEEDEGGHREHREESGGLGIGVDVELRDDRPPVILLGKHVETRGQGFAGRVPGGPEVDHGGNRRLDHACAEGAVSEGQRLRHAGSISREAATSAPCPPGGGR